jgi:hypothetical protein
LNSDNAARPAKFNFRIFRACGLGCFPVTFVLVCGVYRETVDMQLILTIALPALLLTACAPGMWESHRAGPRWAGGPNIEPFYTGDATPSTATPTMTTP